MSITHLKIVVIALLVCCVVLGILAGIDIERRIFNPHNTKLFLCSSKETKQLVNISKHQFLVYPSSEPEDVNAYHLVYAAEINATLNIAGQKTDVVFTSQPFILVSDFNDTPKQISGKLVFPFPKERRNEKINPVFRFRF